MAHCSDLHCVFCSSKHFIRFKDCAVKLQQLFEPFLCFDPVFIINMLMHVEGVIKPNKSR